MSKRIPLGMLALVFLLGACAPKAAERDMLTVMTHDSFAVSEELIRAFEDEHEVSITFIRAGDAGTALNRLILTGLSGSPEADVFYGLDNSFLSRALENDLFESYEAPALTEVPAAFILDKTWRALPIDYGDVCVNYDKAWFAERGLALPASLLDLIQPAYKGLLVVENPATSSPGLAFFLASITEFGEDGWQAWWQALKDNDVEVVSDWETAYYSSFSGSSGRGQRPMVVSYASSPAAELIYAETALEEAPTASIVAAGTCWRQIEFAGIVKGTSQRALAEAFIDFLFSPAFQEDLPLQMFVFSVLPSAQLPEAFVQASQIPAEPAQLAPELIAEKRDAWLQAWSDLMLR